MQHAGKKTGATCRILIIGGSVGFGAYASGIKETYFEKTVGILKKNSLPSTITVLAAGGWVSSDELTAFALRGIQTRPDMVIFLNGLNDLMNQPGYYPELVARYLQNMKTARDIALANNIKIVFAPQPFIGRKKEKSPLEKKILALSSVQKLNPLFYERLKDGLKALCHEQGAYFIDCAGVFDNETLTTFTDQWHFTDPGHSILARELAGHLVPMLKGIK